MYINFSLEKNCIEELSISRAALTFFHHSSLQCIQCLSNIQTAIHFRAYHCLHTKRTEKESNRRQTVTEKTMCGF